MLTDNLICGVIYRHPNSNLNNFLDYINSTTDKINRENKLCLLLGDFNIDLLKIETHVDTDNFLNILGSSFFLPQILQPTRITDHSATLIDNIFFNSLQHFTISGNLVYDLTDHLPNFIIFNKFSALSSKIKIFKRDFTQFNQTDLIEEMKKINWELEFVNNSNPTNMFDAFYNKVTQIINKHIPIKQLSRKDMRFKSKPWITPGIKKSINVKNRIYRKYIASKSPYYHSKFKYYRNKINHLLKLSKKSYYNNYFLKNVNDTKQIWRGIKEIVHFKPKISGKNLKITENNIDITDPNLVADAFNKYFTNIGQDLATQIPNVYKSPMDYMKSPLSNSFWLEPVTCNEIENEISHLKLGKATGPFSIPINILRMLKNIISKPLELIFNLSFSLGIVPQSFKLANVIPVHKKGSISSLYNYRPISLLSVFNKLLEKLMCSRLLSFLDKNNVFYDKQFGFRAKHSTDHAILSIVDKIQTAIDNRDLSCGIFLDFSKAFDTVNHDILIEKLDYYGIRGITKNWFVSYLGDRQQSVIINNVTSDPMSISCGIPQGSVLGPIMFLLYINDFHLCSTLFDFHLFISSLMMLIYSTHIKIFIQCNKI